MLYWDVASEYFYVCYTRDYTKKTMINKQQELGQLKMYLDGRGITKLEDVTTKVLQDYHTEKLRRGLQPASIISTSKQIKAMFNWCKTERYIKENSMNKVELPINRKVVKDVFVTQEVIKLINNFVY